MGEWLNMPQHRVFSPRFCTLRCTGPSGYLSCDLFADYTSDGKTKDCGGMARFTTYKLFSYGLNYRLFLYSITFFKNRTFDDH